jgi:hypothetical protein
MLLQWKQSCPVIAKQAPRRRSIALNLDLGTRWRYVVRVTPRPRFTPGKGPPVPIVQEAGWATELVWTQRLEETSFASSGYRTPVVQSVVRRYTKLPQLLMFLRYGTLPKVSCATRQTANDRDLMWRYHKRKMWWKSMLSLRTLSGWQYAYTCFRYKEASVFNAIHYPVVKQGSFYNYIFVVQQHTFMIACIPTMRLSSYHHYVGT